MLTAAALLAKGESSNRLFPGFAMPESESSEVGRSFEGEAFDCFSGVRDEEDAWGFLRVSL